VTPPFRCSQAAERRADTLVASAPPVQQWLLVEHPGPWGRHILTGSGLDPSVARELGRWAAEHAGRVALIRRPSAPRGNGAPRRWYAIDSRLGREQVRWGSFAEESEVLDVLRDPEAGQPSDEPVYLVCAHGKHDVCCALRGRPVAAVLAAGYPERIWECSHVGGDRFAANLVLLPHGLYYGHVPSASADQIVRAYDEGRLSLRWLRGRSSLSAPVQAAQHYARTAAGESGVGSYPPLTMECSGPDEWTVELAGPRNQQPVTVVLQARTRTTDEPLTCSSTAPGRLQVFDLVDLR
jgi:hypothetical protein